MLALSKSLPSRLVVPIATQVCSVRHKGTVPINTLTHPAPYTDLTMGPYPHTKEERLRAAKKYNLIPEDYEPYDEDEAWGDYPKLPAIGDFNKDKYDDFDEPWLMRHYGEPYHRDHDLYTWERIDPLESKKIPPFKPYWQRFLWFFGTAAFVPSLYYFFEHFKLYINHPYKIRDRSKPKFVFPPSPNDSPHHHNHH